MRPTRTSSFIGSNSDEEEDARVTRTRNMISPEQHRYTQNRPGRVCTITVAVYMPNLEAHFYFQILSWNRFSKRVSRIKKFLFLFFLRGLTNPWATITGHKSLNCCCSSPSHFIPQIKSIHSVYDIVANNNNIMHITSLEHT